MEAFPDHEKFPATYREAWKLVKDMGLEYKKFHTCPNDCMLYRNETANDNFCKHCMAPRYKQFDDQSDNDGERRQKVHAKLVRYFPLKARLQRFFMSSKTAPYMRWHAEGRADDGILRHPADRLARKHFDKINPDFSSDIHNVKLGLAADGFNPFKPRASGNDIDVYLQPLIDELKELWRLGVPTYDSYSKKMFQMRVALIWTINDFLAYANLSGWSTKGGKACPCCNQNTRSRWLKHNRKFCYMRHQRFLPSYHKFRSDKRSFDGIVVVESKPKQVSGAEVLQQLEGFEASHGVGRPVGKAKDVFLGDMSWAQAHRYVLFNSSIVDPFREVHRRLIKHEKRRLQKFQREKIHNDEFPKWFQNHVTNLEESGEVKEIHPDITWLATGPDKWEKCYFGYLINGFRFHTKKREKR